MEHLTPSAHELIRKIKCQNKAIERERRTQILALVDCMSSHGYREYVPKYHINGRHGNISLTLEDNACRCGAPCKLLYHLKSGQVTKGCLSGTCPAKIFAVDVDDNGVMTVSHVEEVDSRRCRLPTMQGVARLDQSSDYMIQLVSLRGLKMADEIFKRQGDWQIDVFDGGSWWFYDAARHIWRVDKSGAHIQRTIVGCIERVWGPMGETQNVKAAIEQLLHDINQPKFRKDMVIDCATAFLDREFKAKLDSNFSLIGCKNGVYDFNIKKLRPGRPSDYITMSTHRNFVDRDVSLEDIVPINEFLTDVLVDPEVITCLLATFCLSLRGVQHAKFFMWTGVGANGKSKLAHLLRNTLGDYGVNLPVQVITSKRIENGKPMPEMS